MWGAQCPETNSEDAIRSGKEAKISNISDLTDNGTVVEVYVSEDEADFITDVVVVKSQLMEVKKVGSDYVSLEKKDPDDGDKDFPGFNQDPIDVKVGAVLVEGQGNVFLGDFDLVPVDFGHVLVPQGDAVVGAAHGQGTGRSRMTAYTTSSPAWTKRPENPTRSRRAAGHIPDIQHGSAVGLVAFLLDDHGLDGSLPRPSTRSTTSSTLCVSATTSPSAPLPPSRLISRRL